MRKCAKDVDQCAESAADICTLYMTKSWLDLTVNYNVSQEGVYSMKSDNKVVITINEG